jgi:hypothetical protein
MNLKPYLALRSAISLLSAAASFEKLNAWSVPYPLVVAQAGQTIQPYDPTLSRFVDIRNREGNARLRLRREVLAWFL